MAQLRRNHAVQGKGLQTTFRLVIFLFIAVIILVAGMAYYKNTVTDQMAQSLPETISEELRTYLPAAKGQVIQHKFYTLSYMESCEQAEWAAYRMDRKMLNVPNVARTDHFIPDYSITTRSAFHRDYSNSGYTRGHLVPAGDMAFDTMAMRESFYMSNMAPQLRAFNNGIWKELEENVRDWTYKDETLYIITGPIQNKREKKTIGQENKVCVPVAFYKVLLDFSGDEKKGIGFIIPHNMSDIRLEQFMVSIDSVEAVTGIDFFPDMMHDLEEKKLEGQINKKKWNVSEARYQLRVNKWNWE